MQQSPASRSPGDLHQAKNRLALGQAPSLHPLELPVVTFAIGEAAQTRALGLHFAICFSFGWYV